MKNLTMSYKDESNSLIYLPARLLVQAEPPTHFIRQTSMLNRDRPRNLLTFYLHDFLPSHWSDYATTFDNCYN